MDAMQVDDIDERGAGRLQVALELGEGPADFGLLAIALDRGPDTMTPSTIRGTGA